MSKYINTIEYHLQTKLDESGVTKLMASLREVEKQMSKTFKDDPKAFQETTKAAKEVQKALSQAFESDLGILNVKKFRDALNKSEYDIQRLQREFQKAGKAGAKAFDEVTYQSLSLNKGVKQTSLALEKMANTMWNTVRWGITAGIFQGITTEIRKSFDYAKDLDTSLNSIRIVTGKSAAEMKDFSMYANKAAQSLGAATKAYSDAALIFYQQGLGDVESKEMARLTVTTSNVTGQDTAAVSEQLTSIRNGYKLTTDEMERYLDTTALIAAETAADLEEMATAMSKVSSAANMMGVEYDQLNAMLATVVSVTRQAPENVGTAFKTIFARLGDLKAAGTAIDESGFEVKLGQISTQLNQMGVSILDTNGNMRDMGDIVAEVGTKWDGWTQAQKLAAAQAMAGKRQYNNLVALFENWDMYSEQMVNAANAEGTLAQQNAIYLESVEAHLQQIETAKERVYNAFFDTDTIKGSADAATGLLQIVAQLMEAIGGGIPLIQGLASAAMVLFSNQIASGINKAILSMKSLKQLTLSTEQVMLNLKKMHGADVIFEGADKEKYKDTAAKEMTQFGKKAGIYANVMTSEQTDAYQSYLTQLKEASQKLDDLTNETKEYQAAVDKAEKAVKSKEKATEKENKALDRAKANLEKHNATLEDQRIKLNQVRQAADGYAKTMESQAITKGFTKMAGAVGQFTFALSSALNVIDILNNENLSGFEKFSQILMAGSMATTSLYQGVTSLAGGFKLVEQTLQNADARQKMAIAQNIAEADSINAKTAAEAQNFFASRNSQNVNSKAQKEQMQAYLMNLMVADSIDEETQAIIENTVASLDNAGAGAGQTREALSHALAIKIDQGAIKGNTVELEKNTTASIANGKAQLFIKLAKNGWVLLAAAVAAATIAIVSYLHKQRKARLEEQKERYKEISTALEAQKVILNEIDNFNKLKDVYDETGKGVDSLKESINNLNESLDNNIIKALASAGAWDQVAVAIKQAEIEALERSKELAEEGMQTANAAVQDTLGIGSNSRDYIDTASFLSGVTNWETEGLEDFEERIRQIPGIEVTGSVNNQRVGIGVLITPKTDLAGVATFFSEWEMLVEAQLEKAREAQTEATMSGNSEDIKKANSLMDAALSQQNQLTAAKKDWNELLEQEKVLTQELLLTTAKLSQAKAPMPFEGTESEFLAWKDNLEKELEELKGSMSDKEFDSFVDNFIGGLPTSLEMSKIIAGLNFKDALIDELSFSDPEINALTKTFGSLFEAQTIMMDFGINTEDKTAIQEFRQYVENNPEIFEVITLGIDAEAINFQIGEAFTLLEEGKEVGDELALSLASSIPALDGIVAGSAEWLGILVEAQDSYTEINKQADRAVALQSTMRKSLSSSLTTQVGKDRSDTDFANRHERVETIKIETYADLEPALEQIADLEEQGFEVPGELKIEVQEALDDLDNQLREQDFQIDIEYSNNLQTQMDGMIVQLNRLKSVNEEIREDYLLTADQFEKAISIYPSMADEASGAIAAFTAEGVQLNKAAAEAIMEQDGAVLKNNLEGQIEKMTVEMEYYAAKQAGYQAAADFIMGAVRAETLSVEAANVVKQSAENMTIVKKTEGFVDAVQASKEASDKEIDNLEVVGDTSDAQAEAGAKSMNNYAQSMSKSISSGVQASIENLRILGDAMADPLTASTAGLRTYSGATEYKPVTARKTSTETKGAQEGEFAPKGGGKADWSDRAPSEAENAAEQALIDQAKIYQDLADAYGNQKTELMKAIADAKARLAAKADGGSGSVDAEKGGSKGGGSEKDSTISDNTLEKLVEIFDQYYDINQEIKKLENSLARVVAVQDSLTGQALIDNLNQQLVIMQSQNEAIEKRLQLEKDERDQLKSELASKGITFDETGTITNYKAKFEELKAAVDVKAEAHKAAKTEAAKEALEKEYDAAKLAFDEFTDLVERYDELNIDIIFNTEMELLEKQLEMIELNVQKMDIELEVTLDTNEAIRKWNEFEAVVLNGLDLEDPLTAITNTVKNLSSYWNGTDGSLDVLSKQIAGLNAEIAIMEAGGESSQYGSGETGISAATEVLKDRMDQYIELSLEYDEIVKSIKENTLNWIDATADGFSEINSQFEYVSSELEHHANVIKLIYGEEAYEQMEGYYEAQRANNSASVRALTSQISALKDLRDQLGQPGDEDFDQELHDRYTAQIQDFQGELNSAIEESLQLLADEYSNSVSSILSNFAKGLSGGLGLPEIEKEWKRINEEADLYLDKTSATFQVTKLQSQYMEAINKADSTQVKQHLNEIMNKELELLREKDELTQEDLERATKRLDIELKKIALEEAQRNKSTMKLQRDAQGNYSYVYTADESKVSAAAEELRAAQEDFYESSRNSLKENKDQFLSLFNDYQAQLAEARTPEDIEKVNESFRKRFDAVLRDNSSITDALKEFYAEEYGEGTLEYENAISGLDDVVQGIMDKITGAGGFSAASEELKDELLSAFGIYRDGIEGVEEDAGRDFDSINASMEEAVAYTQELVDKNEALINKMWEEADAINAATAAWREYDAATAGIRTSGNTTAGAASSTTASPTGDILELLTLEVQPSTLVLAALTQEETKFRFFKMGMKGLSQEKKLLKLLQRLREFSLQ